MLVILGLLGGAVWGYLLARRRGGQTFDRLQYAAVYAIAFGLLGYLLTVLIVRLG